jgi:polyhydroxyalkanoate synthesis repressor PhaR
MTDIDFAAQQMPGRTFTKKGSGSMQDTIVLKKYSNRRLYDTEQSKYVTLSEVGDLIRKGRRVQIIDAKTREDVTGFILTQIVLEQAKNKNALLPVPMLHLIIQYGDNLLNEFFDRYLQQVVQGYLKYKQSVDEQFQRWLDLGSGLSKATQEGLLKLNPLQSFFEGFTRRKDDDEDESR